MFILRVHSVDTNHPLSLEGADFTAVTTSKATAAAQSNPKTTPKFSERKGVVHLFRKIRQSSLPSTASRSPMLFVVAVPNYLSFDDFIRFCGSHVDHVLELVFIRNDGMEDRYSVLIECKSQDAAGEFYSIFNGRKYSPGEAEVCHILFLDSVDYTESEEIAGTPEKEFTELPTCPVCLERLDADTGGIASTLCDHSFQCPCISKWTYLSCQVCRLCQQQDEKPACSVCGISVNPWICIICGFVGCGRYTEGHAVNHWKDTQHCYSLELDRQQIWDYVGDAYVHRLNQSKVDGKIINDTDSLCMSLEEACDGCECSADSGIGGALYSSKVDTIVDEYNRLVASQLENQRQYYESLLMEAKSKKESTISEAVEKAVNLKMQDLQAKLEKYLEEKNAVADINRNLIKDQETWRRKLKEIDEREAASLSLREEKIVDLEEQIRDFTVYIQAQKTLNDMTDSDSIKGGTVLPVPSKQSSPANSRRQSKSGRRRN
ncbi:BRCA1-associated protein-like [Pyrus ussuriensis x Pyrus communis]|uniref:BRCA1-associated protein-like n=1 Tax=Pyrus ussuriensis x Pyrus communis TaxID=2448454 RepID=A0A5N5GXY4_9ROSA|nr:BRCA1-associated protein-like [Pyrus ussuriensis x Pyrus communis]